MGSPLAQRPLGSFAVSAIGLGCMNLSHAYGVPPSADVAAQVLLRALDLGDRYNAATQAEIDTENFI